ncbi:MAG TPA: M28 family metallopeptidase [Terriglobales bacterium]|nr:M28 family metallopeptidase [Terriglobales bacterium]
MFNRLALIFAFALLAVSSLVAESAAAPPLPSGDSLQRIRPEAIRAHMEFLSDDLLEGREAGTRGYDIAAHYIRAQFQEIGLKPGGTDGSYFQQVPLRRTVIEPEQSSLSIINNGRETKLQFEKNFMMTGSPLYENTSIEAPVAFVGYGVVAPEFNHDDYKGLDVKGKIVAFVYGAPKTFPAAERAHFSGSVEKTKVAADHGAVGVLVIWAGEPETKTPFDRFAGFLRLPGMRWLDPKGVPSDVRPQIKGSAYLSVEAAKVLFQGAPKNFDEVMATESLGKLPTFPLAAKVAIHQVSKHENLKSANVAGILPGSDPQLKNEYVLYTAHADHLGIGRAVKGDSIYNGALDNASGTAALIEMAHAFATAPRPPRRSIMFLAVTAEEEGLLGSDYFAHYPTVPITRIAANVNMDEIPMTFDFKDLVALGADHSSLGPLVEAAARSEDVELSPDSMPEENFFVRSDQYSLVQKGIPAVAITGGDKASDAKVDGAAVTREWMKHIYHSPQDDMSQPLSFEAAARFTRLNYAIGYAIANMNSRPNWNPGDYFGKVFGQQQQESVGAGQH